MKMPNKFEVKLAVERARAAGSERHAERCLELVEKMAKENGAVATNALDLAKRAANAEAQTAELDHRLMLTTAERDGFRARAEAAETRLNAGLKTAIDRDQRVRELLHCVPVTLEHRRVEIEDHEYRAVLPDELAMVNDWLDELRKAVE